MSDHDATPDPIDKAYVEAEALLSDDAARAARRARVLTAVAREAAAAPPAASPRPAWRRGRWLAAASVAGLGVLIATHIYTPPRRPAQTAPSAGVTPGPAATSAAPGQPVAAQAVVPLARGAAARRRPDAPSEPNEAVPAPPPPSPPPAAPASIAPEPQAFPAAPLPSPPPPAPPSDADATSVRRARDEATQNATRSAEKAMPGPAFAGAPAPMINAQSAAAVPSNGAARLRAAAATGRSAAVDALLVQGVPVDAADAEGNTALMEAIRAGQPAAAAVLRRHGASLDRRNRAGESARDMAAAKGDWALDQALDLEP